ncbi:MAG: hypothetical protein R3C15_22400 [Thermoleophilia bacterium]
MDREAEGRPRRQRPRRPRAARRRVETVRELLGRTQIFGVCLGHQLLGLALGLPTFKLPFGHRGANCTRCGSSIRSASSSPSRTTASRSGTPTPPRSATSR